MNLARIKNTWKVIVSTHTAVIFFHYRAAVKIVLEIVHRSLPCLSICAEKFNNIFWFDNFFTWNFFFLLRRSKFVPRSGVLRTSMLSTAGLPRSLKFRAWLARRQIYVVISSVVETEVTLWVDDGSIIKMILEKWYFQKCIAWLFRILLWCVYKLDAFNQSSEIKFSKTQNGTRNLLRSSRNQHGLRVSNLHIIWTIFLVIFSCEHVIMIFSASSWTPRFQLLPSPSSWMLPSLVTANAKPLLIG